MSGVNVALDKFVSGLKDSGEFSSRHIKAFDRALAIAKGAEWIEGAVYKRVGPPTAKTNGDLYIATKKLEGGYDMLNLTRSDRGHVMATYSPEKFVKVASKISRSARLGY